MHKGIMILLITGIVSCTSKKEPPPKTNQATIVDVIIAQTKSLTHTVEVNGAVLANEYAELRPEISGRITYLNLPEGTLIAKDAVIARINDADLQAQVAKSKVLLDLYTKTEERLRKLLAVNGVNQADYDVALNNVNSTKADIVYTQAQIDKTVIRAPFSGTMGLRQVSPGSYVTPATILATIQQVDKLKIDFTIPEEYTNIIKKGNTVEVETDALSKTRRKAVIIATEPQIIQTTRNLKVRALLDNNGKVNPGAFVKVFVSAGADTKAIMVPTNSIIPDDKNSQLVIVKDGKASFINVQKGLREANNVEITKGVNVGDSVVVTGVLFARPKSPLKVRSVKTLEKLAGSDSTGIK